jgi:cytochrome c
MACGAAVARNAAALPADRSLFAMAAHDLMVAAILALLVAGLPAATAVGTEPPPPDDEAMLELAWDSGCFNCHDLRERIRGPAWVEVARRYRGDDAAFATLVQKVISGGSGNWGDDAMSPNRRVPEDDVRALVEWLLGLE